MGDQTICRTPPLRKILPRGAESAGDNRDTCHRRPEWRDTKSLTIRRVDVTIEAGEKVEHFLVCVVCADKKFDLWWVGEFRPLRANFVTNLGKHFVDREQPTTHL